MKPFLKWAGNKYRIINRIKPLLPAGKRLIEPFVGAGALFLNTDFPSYLLTDCNEDLINLYLYLQKEGSKFISYCQTYFDKKNNQEEKFYELRLLFNSTDNKRLKSALFVYLNKHCYNGLCRYNANGLFNTPFGKYAQPYFPAKEMFFFYEKAQNAVIKQADFITTMSAANKDDVIYCDPPYAPLSKTANFTSYSPGELFGEIQQQKLAQLAQELSDRGVVVIISNHNTEFIQKIYHQATLHTFDVQRYISSNGANRTKAAEILAVF